MSIDEKVDGVISAIAENGEAVSAGLSAIEAHVCQIAEAFDSTYGVGPFADSLLSEVSSIRDAIERGFTKVADAIRSLK